MTRPAIWTDEKVACLIEHWAVRRSPRATMMTILGFGWDNIVAKAAELDLGSPPASKDRHRAHRNAVGELRHRFSLGFGSPIRFRPTRSLMGAPIKAIDPETQALIDAALAQRHRA